MSERKRKKEKEHTTNRQIGRHTETGKVMPFVEFARIFDHFFFMMARSR